MLVNTRSTTSTYDLTYLMLHVVGTWTYAREVSAHWGFFYICRNYISNNETSDICSSTDGSNISGKELNFWFHAFCLYGLTPKMMMMTVL